MVSVDAVITVDGATEAGKMITFDAGETDVTYPLATWGVSWTFYDDRQGTSSPRTTKRFGTEVEYAWESPGTYEVELYVTGKFHTDDGVKQASDSATTTVNITGSSPVGTTARTDNEIAHAKRIHGNYETALDKWRTFLSKDVPGTEGPPAGPDEVDPDQAMKVRLWTFIAEVIRKANRETEFDAAGVYEKLGIDSDDFAGNYYEDYFDPSNKLIQNLGFGDYGGSHIDPKAFGATKDNVSADASEFITFGRRVLSYRTGSENKAKQLVALVKGHGNVAPEKWDNEFVPWGNMFVNELRGKPYEDQVAILATVFEGMVRSDAGKKFLGELFANRYKHGCIDPFNVLYPPEKPQSARNNLGGSIVSVREGRRSEFFDDDGNVDFQGNKSLCESFKKLIPELAAGAMYFLGHADQWRYNNARADAESIVATFHAMVAAKYWSKSDLEQKGLANDPNDGDIESLPSDARDQIGQVATAERPVQSTSWSMSDSRRLTKLLVDHDQKYDTLFPEENANLIPWEKPEGSAEKLSDAIPLKFGLALLSAGTVGYELREEPPFESFGLGDQHNMMSKTVVVFSDIYDIADATGIKTLPYSRLSAFFDVLQAVWGSIQAHMQWNQHDYDAAYASMMSVTGSVMLLAGAAIGKKLALSGIKPLVIVGAVISLAGTVWGWSATDSEFEDLLAVTRFGKWWDSENFDASDLGRLEFGFERDGVPNYSRQLSACFSQVTPIGMRSASLDAAFTGEYSLTVELKPPYRKDVVSIKSDGVVYLRPRYEGEFTNILHRIKLSDPSFDYGTDASSKVPCIPWNTVDDLLEYYDDFAPQLPEKHQITRSLVRDQTPHTPAFRELRTLKTVTLSPDPSERENESSELTELTIKLSTPFAPALLGSVPKGTTRLDWPSPVLLEAIYVPPEVDALLQAEDMDFLQAGIAEYPTLSRDVVEVQNTEDSVPIVGRDHWARDESH